MGTQVLITIDTELAWRHFVPGEGWEILLERSFDPARVGVPWQLALLARHGLKACFFVDPMPTLLFGPEPVKRMIAPILEAGQEVQLHLHSFWSDIAGTRPGKPRFELTDFDGDEQRALIATARDLLVAAGAPMPTAFRSGSYAADARTLDALHALGIACDSSHNGAEHPWPSALPLPPDTIDPERCGETWEIPVSLIRSRGALRPLQICALSAGEMAAALCHARDQEHPLVTIVGHSFELATRDGRRVNGTVRRRFERLCAFLAANRADLPTAAFAELELQTPRKRSQPMDMHPVRVTHRMAEQLWADARYERPAVAAAAIGGPSLLALDYLGTYGGL